MELINDGADKVNAMKLRELERKLNLQKKQDIKKTVIAENEQLDFFQKTFDGKQCQIENLLKQAETLSKKELPEHFNVIYKEILLLQKYVASSNLFLQNYFLQKCQNALQELQLRAKTLENDLLPKKKFGFKNKPVKIKSDTDTVDSLNDNRQLSQNQIVGKLSIDCGFHDKSHETLTLSPEELEKKDVCLENLNKCKIYLKGHPSTLHLNHLQYCQVFSGPVSTSIFAENCHNCTLVIACQQLRLHASKNVNIYLQVTSRAIMEDCSDIAVAPYNWSYEGIERDFKQAGLNRQVNNWKCIDDFNWLNSERHSPNWKEIVEDERVNE
ncbi:hypothetical protein ABEB36_003850 [Hypothenemus hampei]|uniref:C-CAP/cofactor C-like domain-containing protein n=1 Tax=Hypothenemus hampei TaxID=57062 RepID=A0ABD1F1G6_HYPHA